MVLVSDNRLEWIDWMKVLGIYLVVLGHFYSIGEKFIYVFHMPLFFIISGFLSKKENDVQLFWKKIWYNLVVPMLMIATLNFIIHCILLLITGDFSPIEIYWFIRNIIFGLVSGFDNLWFVYTLIILKIIFQYCSSSKLFYFQSLIMLVFAYIYNNIDFSAFPFFLKEPNAIVDVCTAYPFYAIGIFVRNYKSIFIEMNNKIILVFCLFSGLLSVLFSCFYNGSVGLHRCEYGGNMFWFLMGGVSGSLMIFSVSKMLGHATKTIAVISRGTIIILGFHKLFISLIFEFVSASYFDIAFAALIIVLFIPIIIAIEKYFPLMMGKYRINKKNHAIIRS